MYVTLSKKFLEKEKGKAAKEALKAFPNDDYVSDTLLWSDLEADLDIEEITDKCLKINIDSEMGYFSIEIPLDMETLVELIEILAKKVNKIKTILEASK